MYPDVEAVLIAWLENQTGVRAVAELPAGDIVEPLIQVVAFGGADTAPNIDVARVDVDVFQPPDGDGEPALATAHDTAEQIRWLMLSTLPGTKHTIGPVPATVANVRTISRPVRRPWDESDTRRIHASYAVTIKAAAA